MRVSYITFDNDDIRDKCLTVVAQQQFGFFVLVEVGGRDQMGFGALLDGEQPLSRTRPVGDDVELVFVADADAARVRVSAGRGLDQRDDRRLFGDLELLYTRILS